PMADDRSREPFNKGKPMSSGGPLPGGEKKPTAPPAKVITPIPLRKPDSPPVKSSAPPAGRAPAEPPRAKAARLQPRNPGRLTSLDAYRGFIMMMLAAGGFGIARFASIDESSPV